MRDLGYKRFIFTLAQQTTLVDLLTEQYLAACRGSTPLEAVHARKYKGLLTSIRRQSVKQADYLSQLAKDSANPKSDEVGYAHS